MIKLIVLLLVFLLILISLIVIYGYHSGSCKIKKRHPCNKDFCLIKDFKTKIPNVINKEILGLLENKSIQKRVNISSFVENIFNCALPNKKGITISTNHLVDRAPNLIDYYENILIKKVSKLINLKLYPTNLKLPTSCALLIYENEGDWINWHYDYNYYNGRFFTVLVPITNHQTCTRFQYKNDENKIISVNLVNNKSICFEGDYIYHRASKLCKNEKRVLLSCQYVTNNKISTLNRLRLKLKDFAYIGKL